MSAPPSASASGTPGPGYYPDPSIPGYIRYWNGTAWVPGTSRPAPGEGERPPAAPSGAAVPPPVSPPARRSPLPPEPARSAPPAAPPAGEPEQAETGPVFLDEDAPGDAALPEVRGRGETGVRPGDRVITWDDPSRLHGDRPGSASDWRAGAARRGGSGGEREDRVPRSPGEEADGGPRAQEPGPDPRGAWVRADAGPAGGSPSSPSSPPSLSSPPLPSLPSSPQSPSPDSGEDAPPVPADGTVRMRPVRPGESGPAASPAPAAPGTPAVRGGSAGRGDTVGLRRTGPAGPPSPGPAAPAAPAVPAPAQPAAAQAPAAQPAAPAERPSWTRQVQELAQRAPVAGTPAVPAQQSPGDGGPDRVVPWRPPVADPFQAALRQARPAGLGRRLAARLVDGLVLAAVTGAVAYPFAGRSADHIREQVRAAEQAGVTREVWLVDGTTGVYLAIVLGAFLLFGLLYEVLPTARWGRTPGKKLFGVRVLDIEEQDPPSFGAALRRWLVFGPLALLGIGVVNAAWCLFDRPWRQCWHDKAARTFVARGPEGTAPAG
ncbi:RDD family protein [Streptomyces sp. TRM 70361]|uniref:RDD family protein n=1 Tax=Streptomyces sp. TRM 70361 TaxID=3116553 RepID=UPI002E7B1580|nr:RDD family protein [Streptomyces sp. TRM 70361]MEE1937881.1 RDD family protein [Streptomyces sp. TRM 70361]